MARDASGGGGSCGIDMAATINGPELWAQALPQPRPEGHKYDRGHAVILGAETYTGATRLAAEACSRIGAGLVTVHTQTQAQVYRTTLPPDIMVRSEPIAVLNRPSTFLAGSGGCNDAQAAMLCKIEPPLDIVLDADAIRIWQNVSAKSCIITPHAGEFARYFEDAQGDAAERASQIAKSTGLIVVLKGHHTVIAGPDGQTVTNTSASPYLAKAGTGDVLAGLITGLLTQGMSPFEAACAAVWIHSQAGLRIGPGLIPQDILGEIRPLLTELLT